MLCAAVDVRVIWRAPIFQNWPTGLDVPIVRFGANTGRVNRYVHESLVKCDLLLSNFAVPELENHDKFLHGNEQH
jgi:hypothetical protein